MPSPSLVLSPHSQNVTFLFTMMDWKIDWHSVGTWGLLVGNDWPCPDRNTAPILRAVHQKAGSVDGNSINIGEIRRLGHVPYFTLRRTGSLFPHWWSGAEGDVDTGNATPQNAACTVMMLAPRELASNVWPNRLMKKGQLSPWFIIHEIHTDASSVQENHLQGAKRYLSAGDNNPVTQINPKDSKLAIHWS